jgi:hypothetical protein
MEARGRRGAEIVMVALRPTPPMPAVIMRADRDDTDERPCQSKGTQFYHGIVVPS